MSSSTQGRTFVEKKVAYVCLNKQMPTEIHTIQFDFPGFPVLPHRVNSQVKSPCANCHGYLWRLLVSPGGEQVAGHNQEAIVVHAYLELVATAGGVDKWAPVLVQTSYRARIGNIEESSSAKFAIPDNFECLRVPRATLFDPARGFLQDGTLTILVDIQVWEETPLPLWTPTESQKDDLLQVLNDTEFADVSFVVGDKKLPAHRCILAARAPTLCELIKNSEKNGEVEVPPCVDSSIFEALLRFVYGRILPDHAFMNTNSRALLKVADRFGCNHFKLSLESEIVKSMVTADTAAEWLLFADSHACALLKEAATNQFKLNPYKVMSSSGWAHVKESAGLLSELLWASISPRWREHEGGDPANMDVTMLREQLDELGLEVDGTREMLVKRLQEANE